MLPSNGSPRFRTQVFLSTWSSFPSLTKEVWGRADKGTDAFSDYTVYPHIKATSHSDPTPPDGWAIFNHLKIVSQFCFCARQKLLCLLSEFPLTQVLMLENRAYPKHIVVHDY